MRQQDGGRRFDVVGFGFGTFDHLCVAARPPALDAKQQLIAYTVQPGGQIPTALVALQRWGLRTSFVGPLGDDEGGRVQLASLEAEGVDLGAARVRRGVGGHISIILVDAVSGERTVLWRRPEALALRPGELDRGALTAGRCLFMDADDVETAIVAARWAKEDGVMVVLDVDQPGPRTRELLASTDVLIVSSTFLQQLYGGEDLRRALRAASALGPAIVVATLGAGGALACAGDRLSHVPAFRVRTRDTTSAGDVFHAGCIYGLLAGWPLERTLVLAAAAAALECEQLGGRAAIPPLDRALALAATHRA